MRKTLTVRYPASPERVATMLADEGFQRSRVAGLPQAATTGGDREGGGEGKSVARGGGVGGGGLI